MKNYSEIQMREAMAHNIKMLEIGGHWPPEGAGPRMRLLYGIYGTAFVGFWFLTYTVSEIANIILSFGDLTKLVAALFLFLTHLAQVFKLYFFITNSDRIKALIAGLDRDVFKPKNRKQHEIIASCIRETKLVYSVFAVMCLMTCALWGVFPFMDQEDGLDLALPLAAYYPFRTDYYPVFQIIFAYQIVATSINAINNISMDTLVTGLMALMCAQLDILNDTLANVREFAEERLKAGGKGLLQDEHDLNRPELQQEMDSLLVYCVDHHRNILHVTNEIGVLFNISVLSQFSAGCVIICLTMFELTLAPLLSIKFASMVLYQGCMLVEIIIYCWYGNEVILKSSKLGLSAYSSDWTTCSAPYKKNLLFIMIRTREPIKLYAGNFFTLSLETLVAILRSSWSYFAVLNRKHQE